MKIRPLTKQELTKYFSDYRREFPDWAVEHDVVLTRQQEPLKQRIAFEALRDGTYRPSHSMDVLIAPDVGILPRFLDIKHREILPREHAGKWRQVVRAMEEQFQPSIRKPLDVVEVLRLGEQEVALSPQANANYLTGLAALSAYVGDVERALSWGDRVEERLRSQGRPPAPWELRLADFNRRLRQAVQSGQQRAFLQANRQTRQE